MKNVRMIRIIVVLIKIKSTDDKSVYAELLEKKMKKKKVRFRTCWRGNGCITYRNKKVKNCTTTKIPILKHWPRSLWKKKKKIWRNTHTLATSGPEAGTVAVRRSVSHMFHSIFPLRYKTLLYGGYCYCCRSRNAVVVLHGHTVST